MRTANRHQTVKLFFSVLWCFGLLSMALRPAGAAQSKMDISAALLRAISSVAGMESGPAPKDIPLTRAASPENATASTANLATTTVAAYFPLHHNDVKNYGATFNGTYYSAIYTYTYGLFNDRMCYRETDSLDGSKAYFGHAGTALEMYGASLEGETYAFDTPLTILNDAILTNGGTLNSSTTLTVEGVRATVQITVTSMLVGAVTIPLGRLDDCRSIKMTFRITIPGESESEDLEDVWILAPQIGKLKIAVFNQFMVQMGWMTLTGGTIGGVRVADLLKPSISGVVVNPQGVGVPGVALIFSNGMGSTSTDSAGRYSRPVTFRWSGTLTPLLAGCKFTPTLRQYDSVAANLTDQNFTVTVIQKKPLPFLNLLLEE
jgi:hypothetical protein